MILHGVIFMEKFQQRKLQISKIGPIRTKIMTSIYQNGIILLNRNKGG